MMTKAFVLLSGGLDSATVLAKALEEYSSVETVSIAYGQRHVKEIEAAQKIAEHYGVTHVIQPLVGIFGKSMLTDATQALPNASYDDLPKGISPTYVPFRNGLMLAVLASRAQKWVREREDDRQAVIMFGAHAEDAQNWAYPDCTPEFIGAMANAIFIGTYQKVRLVAPLQSMTKDEIVVMGTALKVPYALTWSCYAGGEKHCGTCPTCRARKDAFRFAQCIERDDTIIIDPTSYAA